MIRVLSLLWTLALSILITCLSFFYVQSEFRHGYPFSFAHEVVTGDGTLNYDINYWSVALDVLIWWLLFSLLLVVVRNYILELD